MKTVKPQTHKLKIHKHENVSANWPAPNHVKTLITCRQSGVSDSPYDTLNLGFHVGDKTQRVEQNWQLLINQNQIPQKPLLLNQVHSNKVIEHPLKMPDPLTIQADGIYTSQTNNLCAILTADCLPILLCDQSGTQVAALHAGWRGLAAGIINQGINTFPEPEKLMAYLGPTICEACFEVGDEVREIFLDSFSTFTLGDMNRADALQSCFNPARKNHWLADLKQLARLNLQACGVEHIYSDNFCTVEQPELFYSYRRDGITGRFASMIWLQPE